MLINTMRQYLIKNNFIEIHTPKLIGTASEGGADVFSVNYFGTKAYLAQSPQFYKQMAISSGFDRVFEIAPAFRAENSNSYRHSTEFTSFDVEIAYINSIDELIELEEDMLIEGIKVVKQLYDKEIEYYFNTVIDVPKKPFPKLTLQEIYNELEKTYNYYVDNDAKGDMNIETEKLLSRYILEKYNHQFVFITEFDAKSRPFYHLRQNGVPQGFDLIWNGCEITTGSLRENRYNNLLQQVIESNIEMNNLEFYLNFFKYGCPPHGGFAIGIDRLTMLLLNLPSLKESMFIFRGPHRILP